MGLRIWGSLISENQMSYEVLLDCAADGEGNEYVIVHLPKDQIIETFLLHPIIKMGQIYGSHSIHTNMLNKYNRSSGKKHQNQKSKQSKQNPPHRSISEQEKFTRKFRTSTSRRSRTSSCGASDVGIYRC